MEKVISNLTVSIFVPDLLGIASSTGVERWNRNYQPHYKEPRENLSSIKLSAASEFVARQSFSNYVR